MQLDNNSLTTTAHWIATTKVLSIVSIYNVHLFYRLQSTSRLPTECGNVINNYGFTRKVV